MRGDVPAFTEENRRRIDPERCACRVNEEEIVRCALHDAAPGLVKVLQSAITDLEDFADEDGEFDFTPEAGRQMAAQYRAAIDSTKEKP